MRASRRGMCMAAMACATVVTTGSTFRSLPQMHGVWRLTQSSLGTNDTTITNSSPGPSLVVFTARHYSLMYVEGSAARVPFADPARPTDGEKLAAYNTFVGHSGTYSVTDSLIEMHIVVAKSPSLMGTDMRPSFPRFTYSVRGDTLWMTRRGPGGVFRMKLVRAE